MDYLILGPMAVHGADGPLSVGGTRQRAVLAALLLANGRSVDVEQLIEQVWDEWPPAKPLASVRSYIANLRRILGGEQRLVTDTEGYRLLTAGDRVDAREFEQLVGRGRRLLAAGDADGATEALDSAMAYWRGAPLSDFRDLNFVQHEVHRLDTLRADAVEARFEAGLRMGRSADLLAELETEVAANPMRERLWWQLMLAMYRAGRRSDALRAYERVQAVLDRELGVTPGSALERLAHDIRTESADLQWRTAVTSVPALAGGPDGLFGRAAERNRLGEALSAAARGCGGIVMLTGESGVGKTALARDVVSTARDLGMATVWAGHSGETRRPPSWAWTHTLRSLAGQLGSGGAVGPVTPLPQWWSSAAEDANAQGAESHSSFDALQATVTAVAELAAVRPAVVLLDDLQRADRSTHEVLELLASCAHSLPLLIVGTWQTGGGDHRPDDDSDRLLHRTDVDTLRLRGIGIDATAALIARVSGTDPSPGLVAAIHDRTGGNPFYTRELVRLLVDSGRLDDATAAISGGGVPEAVSGVIRRRMSVLPELTRTALVAAAVWGPEFAVPRLAAAQGVTATDLATHLEPARRAGLIDESAEQPGGLRFTHGLVRDAIAAQLTATQQAEVHAAIARVHAGEPGQVASQDAVDGAHHAWRAAGRLEPESALLLFDRARADAFARSAYREVAELDRRALDICARLPDGPARFDREVDLRLQLASVEAVVSGQASAKVLDGLRNSSELGPDVVQSTAAVAMGCLEACGTGRYHDATVLADGLVDFFRDTSDPIAGAAGYYTRALTEFMLGHLDRALDAVATLHRDVPSLDVAQYGPLASFEVLAYGVAGHAHGLRGDVADAQATLAAGAELGDSRGDAFGAAVVRTAGIQLAAMTGVYDGLAQRAGEVVGELTRLGIDQFVGGARLIHGWARAKELGENTSDEVRDAFALHSQGGRRIFSPMYLGLVFDIALQQEDTASAQESLSRADTIAAATRERVWDAQLAARRLKLAGRLLKA